MGGIPPGITYLSRAVPYFALPSIAAYILLSFFQSRLPFHIPNPALIAIAVLARPSLFLFSRYYSRWANKRAAEAKGAIVAPYVQDSPITVIRKILDSLENGYPADFMLRWTQEYGHVVNADIATTTMLWTNEPEHLKAMLATQFESFVKGPLVMSQLDSLFGQGVFSTDGEIWKFHRAMTRPFFTRERISDFEIYDRNWETSFNLARGRLAEASRLTSRRGIIWLTTLVILVNQLINLLIAGRDTTMGLLAFSIYMIAEHPDMEKRLREEIYEKVGPINGPKYEHMREMKYMRAFLNEVLRLYPTVPMNSRTSTQAVVLPAAGPGKKPIYVPKGTTCSYTVINMHRRTDLWGPDGIVNHGRQIEYCRPPLALIFDPDRFLDARVQKYLVPNPYIFCPFNAGPRICLGQQFAYHEASYFLVRLLQHFTDFKLDSNANLQPPPAWKMDEGSGLKQTEKIVPTAPLTMYIKGGLWINMKEVKQDDI